MSNPVHFSYQLKTQSRGLTFDPRTKILLLIEMDILLFLGRSIRYESGLFLLCVLILFIGEQRRTALKCAGIFFLFVLTQQIIAPYLMNPFVSLVHFIVVIVRKVLPAFMLAKWLIATTDVSEFVAAMWKCKIPQNIIVTTSVVFRCFPTIREEWKAIQTAMQMRGIALNLRNIITKPSETIIHLLVPLFISVLNISDELAAAALCRGLDNPGTHTCMREVHFRWYDVGIVSVITAALAVISMLVIKGYHL